MNYLSKFPSENEPLETNMAEDKTLFCATIAKGGAWQLQQPDWANGSRSRDRANGNRKGNENLEKKRNVNRPLENEYGP